MDPMIMSVLIGLGVVGLVTGLLVALNKSPSAVAEERLAALTTGKTTASRPEAGMLLRPDKIDFGASAAWIPKLDSFAVLYEKADVGMEMKQFLLIPVGLAVLGAVGSLVYGLPWTVAVGAGLCLGFIPFLWLIMRKHKRVKQFVAQMPDALELVGRALRAGHSLASGFKVVADEMAPPIAVEFGRVYEEQNFGIPIEDALSGLAERIPTMDVRFFVTAVVIQRATGGDLAEILDKIGRLIRERFQLLGQVQALTGEGRLSGICLLALPPALLVVIYILNPEYVSVLFTTTIGTKLLAGAAIMQGLGAVAIKKIITIKV